MKKIFIIILFFGLISCEPYDFRLKLINNSEVKVRYLYEVMNYQDSIPSQRSCDSALFSFLLPKEKEILKTNIKWEFQLKEKTNKILRIYILNEDTFKKYTTCEFVNGKVIYYVHDSLHNYNLCNVFKQGVFLKRYNLKYDDLVRLDWKVVYDGK